MNIEDIGGIHSELYAIVFHADTDIVGFNANQRLKDNWSWHPDLFANLSNVLEDMK